MESKNNISSFPLIKNTSEKLLSDGIISLRPGETLNEAVDRFRLEQRCKKILKIQNKIKGR